MRQLCCLLLFVAPALADDADPVDPKIKPREIKVTPARPAERKAGHDKYTTVEELAKAHGKEVADAVAKEVNFKKEFVVVFTWSGSGMDKLDMAVEGKTATFTKTFGRTRDLRFHFKVFALPNGFTTKTAK